MKETGRMIRLMGLEVTIMRTELPIQDNGSKINSMAWVKRLGQTGHLMKETIKMERSTVKVL